MLSHVQHTRTAACGAIIPSHKIEEDGDSVSRPGGGNPGSVRRERERAGTHDVVRASGGGEKSCYEYAMCDLG